MHWHPALFSSAARVLSWLSARRVALGATVFLIVFATVLQFLTDTVTDGDSLAHIRLAWLYRTEGLFDTSFPWVEYSVLKDLPSDLQYGFHLLLVPFSFFSDLFFTIFLAGGALTATLLVTFYYALRRFAVPYAAGWTVLMLLATGDMTLRMTSMRPQVFSLALVLLLFLAMNWKREPWLVCILSCAISFVHMQIAWTVGIVVFVMGAVLYRSKLETGGVLIRLAVYALFGTVLGALLHPHPIAGLQLWYISIVRLGIHTFSGVPLQGGYEMGAWEFLPIIHLLPFLFLFVSGSAVLYSARTRFPREVTAGLFGATLIALVFLALTVAVAQRAQDYVVVFGMLPVAYALSYFLMERKRLVQGGFLLFAITVASVSLTYATRIRQVYGVKETDYKEISLWLREHTEQNTVVAHLRFNDFYRLFFWNQHNHYIGASDSVFQYEYSPELYYKLLFPKTDRWQRPEELPYTCAAVACTEANKEPLFEVLVRDFNAKYLVIDSSYFPMLAAQIPLDPRFRKIMQTETLSLYCLRSSLTACP